MEDGSMAEIRKIEKYVYLKADYYRDENNSIHSGSVDLQKNGIIIKDAFLGISASRVYDMNLQPGSVIEGYLDLMQLCEANIFTKERKLEYLGSHHYLCLGEIKDIIEVEGEDGKYIDILVDCGINIWSTLPFKFRGRYQKGDYLLLYGRLDFRPKKRR